MSKSRLWALLGASALVLAVVVVAVRVLTPEPPPPPPTPDPITTTLELPGPLGDPIEISEPTELAGAMPRTVFDHVLTSAQQDPDVFGDHRALEGWDLTYSAAGSDVQLQVLQWPTAEEAHAYAEEVLADPALLADGDGRRSGDVAVDGEVVGRYDIGVLSDPGEPTEPSTPEPDDPGGVVRVDPLGPGLAVWTNGTVAFVAHGDAARLAQFYDYFRF